MFLSILFFIYFVVDFQCIFNSVFYLDTLTSSVIYLYVLCFVTFPFCFRHRWLGTDTHHVEFLYNRFHCFKWHRFCWSHFGLYSPHSSDRMWHQVGLTYKWTREKLSNIHRYNYHKVSGYLDEKQLENTRIFPGSWDDIEYKG